MRLTVEPEPASKPKRKREKKPAKKTPSTADFEKRMLVIERTLRESVHIDEAVLAAAEKLKFERDKATRALQSISNILTWIGQEEEKLRAITLVIAHW